MNKDIRNTNSIPQTYLICPESLLVKQKPYKPNNEIYTLLGCYTPLIGSELPKFQDKLLVPKCR